MTSVSTWRCRRKLGPLLVVVPTLALSLVGCASSTADSAPEVVAFAPPPTEAPTTTIPVVTTSSTTTTRPIPEPGTPDRPFTPLPETGAAVILTDGGIPVRLKESTADGWLVETPCSGEALVSTGTVPSST